VAACSDAPSPTAAADTAAPRQGRMLQPGQASQVEPGDFIVYRPEDYKKFGISTFSASAAAPSAYYGECNIRPYEYDYIRDEVRDDGCGGEVCYDVNGGQIECGSDPCYDRYGNYLCGQPTCYDAYGNVIQCGDPCYNSSGYYVCPTSPTGPPTQQNYGSSAPYDGWVNTGGVLLKQLRLISFSQSIANVASFTVDAAFKNVGAGSGYGCNNTAQAFDYASAYGTGSGGYLEVSRVAQWNGTIKWQVDGTHTFNPVSGATGGGTFYTTANFCG
jgi:hypothetical protein